MSDLSNRTFNQDEQRKLAAVIREGVKVKQEMKDLGDSLRDLIKSRAEELGIEPKVIRGAINATFKQDLNDRKEHVSNVEELLQIAKI